MDKLEEWRAVHQPFELGYHKNTGIAWCSDEARFKEWWDGIADWIADTRDSENYPPGFMGLGRTLDIGCGPRPPFLGTVIDPLAQEYVRHAPGGWWMGVGPIITTPAETHLPALDDRFDTVVCWNCLDHTYDWRAILDNVVRYMKDDALFALATDFRPPHIGHPGYPQYEFHVEIHKRFKVLKSREHWRDRELCLVLAKHG